MHMLRERKTRSYGSTHTKGYRSPYAAGHSSGTVYDPGRKPGTQC